MTTPTVAAPAAATASPIDPRTSVGAVTLSVADLARSSAYYQEHIGLAELGRDATSATFGVAGLPLLHLRQQPGARVVRRATGLYHFALLLPSRRDLALIIKHFAEAQTPIGGASDHIVSEALYLSDPDGHGIEIYRDRPRERWYDAKGSFLMTTVALDIYDILGELGENPPAWGGLPQGTTMGHVHLQVARIPEAESFYLGVLGMDRMAALPQASFVSAGGYHHHLGMNTWAGVGVGAPPEGAARLIEYELVLPDAAALDATLERIRAAQAPLERRADGWLTRDPSHNHILLRAG
ncbi:VOC family protein [Chloroflexia bacterium SDU3-3]|nr:VOC family protein [Chloroflexia bacterium SDU3-3]